ncbi:MAG TPA: SPFH domain-containing protein [Terriglobia bacterium]|nr:SPFH domain-containing protein [Terriglobia bacterium]
MGIDFLLWFLFGLLVAYVAYKRKLRPSTLLPYQRGVLFLSGLPARDMGPGKHWIWIGKELLVYLDTRPTAVHVENQVVALTDGTVAVYSITAAAKVEDVRKALYSARNYNQVPGFLMLSSARRVLNSKSPAALMAGRESVNKEIIEDVIPRLAATGFTLSDFRLTQLSAGRPQQTPLNTEPQLPPGENRPN